MRLLRSSRLCYTRRALDCLDPNTILDLQADLLTTERRAAAEQHLDGCTACREMAAELLRSSTAPTVGELKRGTGEKLGRYLLLERLGSGAMAVVYAAYDPTLDRKIALKLLRAQLTAEDAQARLVREARAVARLSHPNVITVHEVGTFEDQVFIALELVPGKTLRAWLNDAPRSAREILDAFSKAGRGLAAAHAAGLVHRDFKPENVLVGDDGRVRVTDFGLARGVESAAPESNSAPSESREDFSQTRSGTVLGTPVYMPLEQLRGERADAKSDQYSFCAALYEALAGTRPFVSDSLHGLAAEIEAQRLVEPAEGRRLPSWIKRVLKRGLSARPEDRFDSMESLLALLERDPEEVRKRRTLMGGALASALLLVGVGFWSVRAEQLICSGADGKLETVWNAQRKSEARGAFLATGKSFAADTWDRVSRALDAYSHDWRSAHVEACEATRVRREQSEELMDRRMLCLESRRLALGALVDLFAQADAKMLEKAVEASAALPRLSDCADAAALSSAVPVPKDEATRARVQQMEETLAKLRALRTAGKYAEGLKLAQATLPASEALHYRPSHAELLSVLGDFQEMTGDVKSALPTLEECALVAEATHKDKLAADTWSRLTFTAGVGLAQPELVPRFERHARVQLERLGFPARTEGELEFHLSSVRIKQARYAEGLEAAQRALALLEKSGASGVTIAGVHNSLGAAHQNLSHYPEAKAEHHKALALYEQLLGPEHPLVGTALMNLAIDEYNSGGAADALKHQERALEIFTQALGPDHPRVGKLRMTLGVTLDALGRGEEGLEHQLASVRISEKNLPPNHPDLAQAYTGLAKVYLTLKRYPETDDALKRSLEIRPENSATLTLLGNLRRAQGRPQEALHVYRDALGAAENTFGKEHPEVGLALTGVGEAMLELKQPRAAVPVFERAVKIHEDHPGTISRLAKAQLGLAQAIWEGGGNKKRALELAREAAVRLERARQWLAEHGGSEPRG